MSSSVQFSLPSSSLFLFPPSNDPRTLPPPPAGSTLRAPPFSIDSSLFNSALNVKIPITIAATYAVTVSLVNAYNRSKGNKAWPISKTMAFFWFVVAHNVFLAVYSAWTFVGMFKALKISVENPRGPTGLVGTVDSLCRIHGIRGTGNAIAYNPTASAWVSQSPATLLSGEAGTPDPTDLGRLWNEGLAFYGWFFYLSKFYEVLDTAIILAKGKRSSTLQTYHHAGAMMCMWAGIRYMSPPIWMFCFVNSGIHALMYTYYTLTAFSIPIPPALKRSLTTMQIIQFLVGVSYAMLHSFISYTIPIQTLALNSSISKTASVVSSSISSVATSATSAGITDLVKKFLFRAAGEEGLAENVNHNPPAVHTPVSKTTGEDKVARYTTSYQTVPCVVTSGQTFAIWLNVLYLAPLTVLFVRFFIKSYIRRTSGKGTTRHGGVETAGLDAVKGVERELNGFPNGHTNGKAVNKSTNGSVKMNGKH